MADITTNGTGGGPWSSASTWSGGVLPQDNGTDTPVIQAGDSVLMDVDQSGWANGCNGVVITGSASGTPGRLYFANGTNGHLVIKSGTTISGTNVANRGQLVATSDGTLAASTPVQSSNRGGITFKGTGRLLAQYLDVKMLASHPTNPYLTTYYNNAATYFEFSGETAVNPTTDRITLGSTSPVNTVAVKFKPIGAAVLPTPLREDLVYYIYNPSGNSFQLVYYANTAATLINITAVGSGTIAMFTQYTNAQITQTFSVLEDLAADTYWSTVAGQNRVVLIDTYHGDIDAQRGTISAITNATPDTIQVAFTNAGNSLDSQQQPHARLYLVSRNVFLRFETTGNTSLIDFVGATTNTAVFDCEILNTAAHASSTQSTNYGYGIVNHDGNNLSIGGVLSCLTNAVYNCDGAFTCNGKLVSNGFGIRSCNGAFTFSGEGASSNIETCTGPFTFNGQMLSCNSAISSCNGAFIASGDILGSYAGMYSCNGVFRFSGKIHNGYAAMNSCSGSFIFSGASRACPNIAYNCGGNFTFSGIGVGGYYSFYQCVGAFVVSGQLSECNQITYDCNGLYTLSGTFSNMSSGTYQSYGHITLQGAVFTNMANQIWKPCRMDAYDSVFEFPTVFGPYVGNRVLCRSFRHGGVPNDTRGASGPYGNMTHTITEYPPGTTYAHKFTFLDGNQPTMFEWDIQRPSLGNTITIRVFGYNKGTGLTNAQCLKWEIIDLGNDPLFGGGNALSTFQSTYQNANSPSAGDTNFEAEGAMGVVSYMPVDDRPLVLRVSAYRASGNAWAYFEIPTIIHRFPVPSFPPT